MTLRRIVALAFALALVTTSALAAPAQPAPAGKINVNTASVAQLESVPGIGPSLAARIVEDRTKSGSFRSTSDLMSVKGLGEKKLPKFESYLSVGEAPKAATK
jgi:competence protein ComEA